MATAEKEAKEISAHDLHNPHTMKVDQRTLQAVISERHDYLRIEGKELKGRGPDGRLIFGDTLPTVYIRDGEFYQSDGRLFDFAHYPGGFNAFAQHVKKTHTKEALKAVGINPDAFGKAELTAPLKG